MKQRTAILIAVALTMFVLVLAGSLVFAVNSKTTAANLAAPEQVVDSQLPGVPENKVEQVVNQPAPTQTKIPATNVPGTNPATALPTAAQAKLVSAERASQIAIKAMPGSKLLQAPELVNYKGKMAFEVLLNVATVYVDAFNGKILGTTALVAENQQPPTDTGNGGNGGGGENVSNQNTQPDPSVDPGVPNNEPPQNGGGNGGDDNHDDDDDHGKGDRKGGDKGGDDHGGEDHDD